MKKVSVLLGIVGSICLVIPVLLYLNQTAAETRSEALLESMRESAAAGEAAAAPTEPKTPQESSAEAPGEPDPGQASQPADPMEAEDAPEDAPVPVDNPYRDSFLANEDMAAWIKIDDTVIDYPVMWTPRDENYYLHRNFRGRKDDNGCLILDTDSSLDPLTTNLIIHGHNMRSGKMFGTLPDYEDPEYCAKHSVIALYTEDCMRRYEVVAVFRSQVYRTTDKVFKFYKFFQADNEAEFDDFYQNIKALSLYDTGVTAQYGDRFLTLSTCAYHVEQGRFVVVAKEIGSGDIYLPFREQGTTN